MPEHERSAFCVVRFMNFSMRCVLVWRTDSVGSTTHAGRRGHWGKIGYAEPSRFLEALPHELVGRRRVRDARERRHRAR